MNSFLELLSESSFKTGIIKKITSMYRKYVAKPKMLAILNFRDGM